MIFIAGTIPDEDLPLITGEVAKEGDLLVIDNHRINCTQGTAAMLSAALATTNYLQIQSPQAVIAGDIGDGNGSREIYEYLIRNVADLSPDVLTLHYWLPNMDLTKKLCEAGYSEKLVLSNECGMKIHYKKYGGQGYTLLQTYLIPMMQDAYGVTQKDLDTIFYENPKTLLAYEE